MKTIKEIKQSYINLKIQIIKRIKEFISMGKSKEEMRLFAELSFCLLTPQSKAKNCWSAVLRLMDKDLLVHGSKKEITRELIGVRFKNNKAKYIIEARRQFIMNNKISVKSKIKQFSNKKDLRRWLVQNIKGMGYKEASHFLRNIGLGRDMAILDRHILKNLKLAGVIKDIPDSLTKRTYFDIEQKMKKFAENIKIPIEHLDLVLWHRETGEIFK